MEKSTEEWGMVEIQQESGHESGSELRSPGHLSPPNPIIEEIQLDPIIKQMENSYERLEKVLNAFNRMK